MQSTLLQSTAAIIAPSPVFEKNHRILVVDDNEAIHDDFRKILGGQTEEKEFDAEEAEIFGRMAHASGRPPKPTVRAEFEMHFASQGAQALELVEAACAAGRPYALAFMDVRMPPGWDGLDTALKLWELDADLQIVICTAYSDKSWDEMTEKLGNPERVLILKKPFDTIEVLQFAHSLTEKWSLLKQARLNRENLERIVSLRTRDLLTANARLEAEIAGHKAATERIREQAMLLEKARDAIIVRDFDGHILFWNHGAERLYGWTASEMIGEPVFRMLYGGIAAKGVSAAREAVMIAGSWLGELSQKTKDGRIVTADCHWTLVSDEEGRPKSILEINTDITEKKQLELKFLRAQRLDSIGTLAGGIAHDLNNILQPITLAMDLFRPHLTDPESEDLLNLVSTNAQRATSLVKQVLSFARGVEGERVCVRPKELVAEITDILRETFPKTITIEEGPSDPTWHVLGDSTQLHQVLLNLCLNARDAMPDGGTLTFAVKNEEIDEHFAAAHPDAAPGGYIVFTVADTGTGIPESLREKIFDPFFTTKEQGKGTGLGLATTLSIVRSHGGFVTLVSEEGRGATFRVFIPASFAVPERASASVTPAKNFRGKGELILAVDDEATLLTMLRLTLESNGYRVLSAKDGKDAMRAYGENIGEIKAVITDMLMPAMDGPAVIAGLKKLDPAVKIIATTGMCTKASLEMITNLGIERILAKPYPARTMLLALREILGPGAAASPAAPSVLPAFTPPRSVVAAR